VRRALCAHAAAWTLAAADGAVVAVPGVTEVGGAVVEAWLDAPDADELASGSPTARNPEIPASDGADELSLRLSLPSGAFGATLWSAAEGMLGEEKAEGAFEFELPATGAWHWLRIRDAADEDASDAFSLWLRAE